MPRRIAGVIFLVVVCLLARFIISALLRDTGPSPRAFALTSLSAAVCVVFVPWLLGKRCIWFAIIAAAVLQFDLGSAYKVDFGRNKNLSAAAAQEHVLSVCPLPPAGIVLSSKTNPAGSAKVGGIGVPSIETSEFARREYATAVAEIGRRGEQEQALFILKFLIAAAVLIALFRLLQESSIKLTSTRARMVGDTEKMALPEGALNEDLRIRLALEEAGNWLLHNAFFWAAVLASAIIDTRLRFNAKMTETLGCWIQLLEEQSSTLLWETYVRSKGIFFEQPMYAILRSFPNLLTIFLFSGTVYFSLIRDYHWDPNRNVARGCACSALALFYCTCASYHGESMAWHVHCLAWTGIAIVGILWNLPEACQSPLWPLRQAKDEATANDEIPV